MVIFLEGYSMDNNIYRDIASERGLPLNFVVKDYYLMRLLQYVSMYGNEMFILTGGTAINKVYLGEKARFSEDADFEIAGKKDIRSVIAQIDVIRANSSDFFKTERRLLKIYGQVDFFYETSNKFLDKVRLDVAFNEFGEKSSFQKVNEITSPFSQERVHNLYVYKLEELLARKLYAMYNRTEGKDLYDFFYGIQIADNSKLYNAIERFFKRKSLVIEKTLPAIIDKLRSTKEDYIAAKVNNYIPFQFRPKSWKILSNSIADFISRLTK